MGVADRVAQPAGLLPAGRNPGRGSGEADRISPAGRGAAARGSAQVAAGRLPGRRPDRNTFARRSAAIGGSEGRRLHDRGPASAADRAGLAARTLRIRAGAPGRSAERSHPGGYEVLPDPLAERFSTRTLFAEVSGAARPFV